MDRGRGGAPRNITHEFAQSRILARGQVPGQILHQRRVLKLGMVCHNRRLGVLTYVEIFCLSIPEREGKGALEPWRGQINRRRFAFALAPSSSYIVYTLGYIVHIFPSVVGGSRSSTKASSPPPPPCSPSPIQLLPASLSESSARASRTNAESMARSAEAVAVCGRRAFPRPRPPPGRPERVWPLALAARRTGADTGRRCAPRVDVGRVPWGKSVALVAARASAGNAWPWRELCSKRCDSARRRTIACDVQKGNGDDSEGQDSV